MKIGRINSSQDGISQALSAGHGNSPKILIKKATSLHGKDFMPTLRTGGGKSMSKKHSYDMIQIASNTKEGVEQLRPGDSLNYSVPNSKTRRERVGKGVAQTLDTACNQGVIQVNPSIESGGKQPYQQNRVYDPSGIAPANQASLTSGSIAIVEPKILSHYGHKDKDAMEHEISPTLKDQSHGHEPMVISNTNMNGETFDNDHAGTLRAGASHNYQTVNRIRRLTEVEVERLQGLPDGWTATGNYDGVIKPISATQRYKLCGNGVSVPVIELIGRKLLENY